MNKIKEVLKEHSDLSAELMQDEEFVEESKEIFEENGMEFSEEMLTLILEDTEKELLKVQNLPDEKLTEVVGGVEIGDVSGGTDAKKKRTKKQIAGSIAIKVTTTLIGTVLGAGAGLFLSSKWKRNGDKWYDWRMDEITILPGVVGAGTGNVIGYRLGKLVSSKLGFEEEAEEKD